MDNSGGSAGPYVTYGNAEIPADGVSGTSGSVGSGFSNGLLRGWTIGLYYAVGDVTDSVAPDPTGWADPSTLGGGLILGTGPGSTTAFFTSSGDRGGASSGDIFSISGTSAAGGDTVTVMVTAYNTGSGSYANANWRGDSAAFTMPTAANTSSPLPRSTGSFMSAFSVFTVPEPSALASLCGLILISFRRRN